MSVHFIEEKRKNSSTNCEKNYKYRINERTNSQTHCEKREKETVYEWCKVKNKKIKINKVTHLKRTNKHMLNEL